MSQRGGDAQSNLRLSSAPIASTSYRAAVRTSSSRSLEPMEALRYLPWLSTEGWIVTNTTPFVNIGNYPEAEALDRALRSLPRVIAIDVDTT